MEADDLLCSRNARLQKALVGRAQWKLNQPPSLKRERASLEGLLDGPREYVAVVCVLRRPLTEREDFWPSSSSYPPSV